MASFVVETYVPDGDRERFTVDVDGIRAATKAVGVAPVHHLRSYLVPSDEMAFHVVEADSADDVERVTHLARIEVERIVRVIGVGSGPTAPSSGGHGGFSPRSGGEEGVE